MASWLTCTGQPSPIAQVVVAENGVSPGHTGSAADTVGVMSQMAGASLENTVMSGLA